MIHATTDRTQPASELLSLDVAWKALNAVPSVGVSVCNPEGDVYHCNTTIRTQFHGTSEQPISGKNLKELMPSEWAEQRIALIRDAITTGRSVALRSIWRGVQSVAMFHPVTDPARAAATDGSESDLCLIIDRFRSLQDDNDQSQDSANETPVRYEQSSVIDLGPLDALSPRELEVLALLRKRMRIKDIASHLGRSEKTIEKHRQSIGAKLKTTDRLELAQMAELAGLTPEDSKRTRVSLTTN